MIKLTGNPGGSASKINYIHNMGGGTIFSRKTHFSKNGKLSLERIDSLKKRILYKAKTS